MLLQTADALLHQKLETYDTEGLIVIQVAQLEKEKKELSERLRIVAKRVDHIERAYRKEERPLLDKDYEEQQKNDRETFELVQKTRKEGSKLAHQEDMATKARLSRMLDDYDARKEAIAAKKSSDFAKRKAAAQKKIEEEKTKRRNAVLKQREEERQRREQEEKQRQEEEEEAQRFEEGKLDHLSDKKYWLIYTQNVLQRKSVAVKKRRPQQLPLKLKNAKQKRKFLQLASSARRNVPPHSSKLVCSNNEKKKQKHADKPGR